MENLEFALDAIRHSPVLVFDVETSGVDWKRNFVCGYVIGNQTNRHVYLPVRHGGGGNIPDGDHTPETNESPHRQHAVEAQLAEAFKYRNDVCTGPIVGHNLKFDCHFALNHDIKLGRGLVCTQNTQALINEYTKSFSLAALAEIYDVVAKKGEQLYEHIAETTDTTKTGRNTMGSFWQLAGNDPLAVEYATGDGVSTLGVYLKQLEEIKSQKLHQIFELENALIWTLVRLERRGVKIDIEYLDVARKKLAEKIQEAYDKLPLDFNPRSPIQMKAYVEQFRTDWPVTPKGNPSFTEKWLKSFPEGKTIVDLRKLTNLENSFIGPLIERHAFKGRVHPTLNQNKMDDHGTISGRLSCSDPNLQQVPKHNQDLARVIRRAFVADEGMELYEGDYSQMEPRLFAHYSMEPALVDGYNQTPPKDVHTVVAELFNADRNTTAKRMNMGMFTGMFPKAFAGHMGLTTPEATKLWNRWFEMFPGIAEFQKLAKQVIISRGFVRSLLGRRGRLESNQFAYRATSKIIQNSGADVIKQKMLDIDLMLEASGDTTHLLFSVHDSMVWQSPATEEGKEEARRVKEMMEDVQSPPFGLIVPFTVDIHSGANWEDASFGVGK
jgi:DNA polymerase I